MWIDRAVAARAASGQALSRVTWDNLQKTRWLCRVVERAVTAGWGLFESGAEPLHLCGALLPASLPGTPCCGGCRGHAAAQGRSGAAQRQPGRVWVDVSVTEKCRLGTTEPTLKFLLSLDSAVRQKEIKYKFFGGVEIVYLRLFENGLLLLLYFEISGLDQIGQGHFHLWL